MLTDGRGDLYLVHLKVGFQSGQLLLGKLPGGRVFYRETM